MGWFAFNIASSSRKKYFFISASCNYCFICQNKFKFALFSQQILDGYIDATKQTLDLIKKNRIPKFKNKAKDTLSLLNYEKYVTGDIYAGIPYQQKLAEMEANYYEDRPYSILVQLNKHCY